MKDLQQSMFSSKVSAGERTKKGERRREPRDEEARPVYVLSVTRDGQRLEEVRTMHNFSRNGFYFLTHQGTYRPGMQLYVIPSFGCFNFGYQSTVVRVQELSFGEYGVAVQLTRIANLITDPQAEIEEDLPIPELAVV